MWLAVLLAAVPLSDWQYRWASQTEWAPLHLPAHPPRAEGDLYERVQLPSVELRDPALRIDAVIGHFELEADGARIYAYPPDGLDAKGVAGLPWHLVSLPPGTREVTLRVRTSYRLAGIQAVPELGERTALLEDVVRADAPRFVIGALLLLLGAMAFVLFPRRLGVGLGLNALSGGLYSLYYSRLKELVVPLTPGIWFGVWLVSLAVVPIGVMRFMNAVLTEPAPRLKLMGRVHELYGVAFIAAMAVAWTSMSLWGLRAETWASPLLFGSGSVLRILIVVTYALCVLHMFRLARTEGPDRFAARLMLVGLLGVSVAVLANVGAALGLLPTMRGALVAPANLFLTLVLAVIAQRAWARTRGELADRVKEKEAMLRDLHDGVGGITTNIRLLAEMGQRDSQKAMEALTAIAELSTEGLAELRAFTQTLDENEAQLTWAVFLSELRRFGGQLIESHGKAFALEAKLDAGGRPSTALCLTVLRIFREALTNVVKHAGATRVDVDVAVSREGFALSISDDGTGSGTGGGLDTGRGVGNMKARAKELGGELTVVTGVGTKLSLSLPLP